MTQSRVRSERVVASPRARRAMQAQGVHPASVRGTGPRGRIVVADVIAHSSAGALRSVAESGIVPNRAVIELRAEADASRLLALHKKFAAAITLRHGTTISLTDMLLHAVASAMRLQGPVSFGGPQELGLDVEGVVYSIPDASKSSLVELARLRNAVVGKRADAKAVGAGCAVALYNAGPGRADEYRVPPGVSAIAVGVGSIRNRPFVRDGAPDVCATLKLCLAANSDSVSGAEVLQFLNTLVDCLEEPSTPLFC